MTLVPKKNVVPITPETEAELPSSPIPTKSKFISIFLKVSLFFKKYLLFPFVAILISGIFFHINNKINNLALENKSKSEELAASIEQQNLLRQEISKLKTYITLSEEDKNSPRAQAIIEKSFQGDQAEKDDPFYGPKDAENVLMVFSDLTCKLCSKFNYEVLNNLKKDYADTNQLKVIFRDAPLPGKIISQKLAEFAHCAGEQGKYWDVFNEIAQKAESLTEKNLSSFFKSFNALEQNKINKCIQSKRYQLEIKKDLKTSGELGITGVPSIFIARQLVDGSFSGKLIKGAQPYAVIKNEIEKLLGNI